ncbi:hypothetical protein FOZ62_024323 [Perkinsus olseni]|uniref:Uncharacterized protein n=1 Tax=Perkinsus olseni TaxID=32597 RepID=A0A7J6T4K1_PEROL|nr:hypothetical protein FOZ62_024323 [Perkinsus olseni]
MESIPTTEANESINVTRQGATAHPGGSERDQAEDADSEGIQAQAKRVAEQGRKADQEPMTDQSWVVLVEDSRQASRDQMTKESWVVLVGDSRQAKRDPMTKESWVVLVDDSRQANRDPMTKQSRVVLAEDSQKPDQNQLSEHGIVCSTKATASVATCVGCISSPCQPDKKLHRRQEHALKLSSGIKGFAVFNKILYSTGVSQSTMHKVQDRILLHLGKRIRLQKSSREKYCDGSTKIVGTFSARNVPPKRTVLRLV